MSSFENVRPGMRPRFFSQNIAANDPEKKMPSTHANATSLTRNGWGCQSTLEGTASMRKLTNSGVMYFNAQSAFFLTHGTVHQILASINNKGDSLVSIPRNKKSFSS
jgi:hypothetical protein